MKIGRLDAIASSICQNGQLRDVKVCTIDRQHKYLLCGAIGPYASDQPVPADVSAESLVVRQYLFDARAKNARRALTCRALRLAPLCRS